MSLQDQIDRLNATVQDLAGEIQDLRGIQRLHTSQLQDAARKMDEAATSAAEMEQKVDKVSERFGLFQITFNDTMNAVSQDIAANTTRMDGLEKRLSDVERRLAG